MEMFLRGEIANEMQPMEVKTGKLEYSKTVVSASPLRSAKEGTIAMNDWEAVSKFKNAQIPIDQQSIDPDGVLASEPASEVSYNDINAQIIQNLKEAKEAAEKIPGKDNFEKLKNLSLVVKGSEAKPMDEELSKTGESGKLEAGEQVVERNVPVKLSRLAKARVAFQP